MNINNEEITGKIIEREKKIRFLRAKKSVSILACVTVMLMGIIFIDINALTEGLPNMSKDTAGYGAALVSADAGGYVFTAVVAFVLSIIITLLCIQLKKYLRMREEHTKQE